MLSRVERTIREHGLLDRGDRVLCAVSGGPDSMALLHALWELRDRLGLQLAVTTVDHGLRPEARAEAELVAARARDLGVEWRLLAVDVRGARARRRLPHRLPGKTSRAACGSGLSKAHARAIGANKIALGHQADDQVETILFRILRGTGVRGLAGIPYRREMFVRPLLDVERAQILTYLRRRSIPFVEDPSNRDARFARARLRHQVLPALRAENPRLGEALRALAADAARLTSGAPAPEATPDGPPLNRRAAAVVERLRRARGRDPPDRRRRRRGRDLLWSGHLAAGARRRGRAARPRWSPSSRLETTDGRAAPASPSVKGLRSRALPASTPSCCRARCGCARFGPEIACGRAAAGAAASSPIC